ncbi:CaiB/BaiF CoA-transferase family protein [Rhodococcus opacus]|nr:CaiB/BaiF CoA-transferase family protein [Rhodococcus opacus]
MTDSAERTGERAVLAGLTVVSIEQAIAAPLCTRHLADLGARVIKIEHPAVGDTTRHYDGVVRGMSAHFAWLNHGKESAALDLAVDADRSVLAALLAKADVFVSNLAPGALARLGLVPQELLSRHPKLIIVDISGYGVGGPLDHRRAYDLLVQAEGGSCAITGVPGSPAKSGIPIADVGTALYAYSAVLTALYDRERTGHGALIPLAMLDVVAEMMGFALNAAIHAGEEMEPVGMGSPLVAPYGAYPTSDEQTVVLGTTSDREWRRLAGDLLQRLDLVDAPNFARNADRVRHRADLDSILAAWCARRTLDEIQRLADEAGIGNARLNSVTQLAEHEQLAARGRWRSVASSVGDVPALRPPAVAIGWKVRDGRLPDLGEHTEAIRAEVGGRHSIAAQRQEA